MKMDKPRPLDLSNLEDFVATATAAASTTYPPLSKARLGTVWQTDANIPGVQAQTAESGESKHFQNDSV